MTRTFNAFEVFEIAEQIERNGARFYRRAAEIFDDPDVSAMFLEMADWETGHEAIFAAMREQLRGEDGLERGFNLEDAPLDPKAMAGLAAFGINPDPATELTGTETRAHVLKMAIGKEKDSCSCAGRQRQNRRYYKRRDASYKDSQPIAGAVRIAC